MTDKVWGILRRQNYKEFKSLPPDLQAIKDRLSSMNMNVPKQCPVKIVHVPHQQPREECDQTECLGYGDPEPTDQNNYGVRIFGGK